MKLKEKKSAVGMVHGKAMCLLSGKLNFKTTVATGFAVMKGVTKYRSGAVQEGVFTDGFKDCTPLEIKLVDDIVKNWKRLGPGNTFPVGKLLISSDEKDDIVCCLS